MKKKYVLTFFFLLLLISFPVMALVGSDNNKIYCDPFYKNINRIYLSYDNKTFDDKGINWEEVINEIKKSGDFVSLDSDIDFIVTEKSNEETLKLDSNALYIKFLYSYAAKELFSIPLKKNYLATWVEISKISQNKSELIIRESKIIIRAIGNRSNALEVSSFSKQHFQDEVCKVLLFSYKKQCVKKGTTYNRDILPLTQECIAMPDIMDAVIKANEKRRGL